MQTTKTLSLVTTLALASLLIPSCASKQKTKAGTPLEPTKTQTKAKAKTSKSERATGDIREALLHLQRVHFAFDTATLLPDARTALEQAADRLKEYPSVHIHIDGHTDERGTSEYNLGLGDRRARTVADYLMRLGISQSRLHVVTFGKEQPWVSGEDELAHAKNRRAEFRLMRGDVRLVLDDGVLYNDRGEILVAKRAR